MKAFGHLKSGEFSRFMHLSCVESISPTRNGRKDNEMKRWAKKRKLFKGISRTTMHDAIAIYTYIHNTYKLKTHVLMYMYICTHTMYNKLCI